MVTFVSYRGSQLCSEISTLYINMGLQDGMAIRCSVKKSILAGEGH